MRVYVCLSVCVFVLATVRAKWKVFIIDLKCLFISKIEQ